jgi:hypothetical protein
VPREDKDQRRCCFWPCLRDGSVGVIARDCKGLLVLDYS